MAIFNGTDGSDYFGRLGNPETSDTFLMGAGNDFVFGNYGADGFFGGDGIDSVSYRFAAEGVILSLALGGTGGMAAGDSYNSIERVYGSNFDDTISGDGGSNFIYGGGGQDTLNGDGGNDRIFGQDGSDTINGGLGNDYIEGGAGADFINGGGGIDTIGFSTATQGVNANLAAPPPQAEPLDTGASNDALGDVYVSIENISGSAFDDDLRGDFFSNVINGRAGDDFINGEGGNDRLIGGMGDDFIRGDEGNDNIQGGDGDDDLYGGDGNDLIYLGDGKDYTQGGEGNDFFYLTNDGEVDEVYGGNDTNGDGPNTDNGYDTVSYIQATAGVEVYVGGFIIGGPIDPVEAEPLDTPLNMAVLEEDFLTGIERVIGSNFDDAIYGGFGDETIFGGNGDDILEGGSGRDRLIGGNGADDFGFSIGGSDIDAILDFEQGTDTITFFTFDDTLTEADVLATLVDYGTHFVFEFGFLPDAPPVEQRLSVIKDNPGLVLTVDDFTIELIEDFPLDPFPDRPVQEPLADVSASQDFVVTDMAFFDVDALI